GGGGEVVDERTFGDIAVAVRTACEGPAEKLLGEAASPEVVGCEDETGHLAMKASEAAFDAARALDGAAICIPQHDLARDVALGEPLAVGVVLEHGNAGMQGRLRPGGNLGPLGEREFVNTRQRATDNGLRPSRANRRRVQL